MNREVLIREGSIGKRFIDRYMAESFNFGGETKTRAEIYRYFEEHGFPSRAADYWLIGAEQAKKEKRS
jgi:hypothetical protein